MSKTVEERAKAFSKEYKALCDKYDMEIQATVNPGLRMIDTFEYEKADDKAKKDSK